MNLRQVLKMKYVGAQMAAHLFLSGSFGEEIPISDIVDVDIMSKVAFVRGRAVGELCGYFCCNCRCCCGRIGSRFLVVGLW